MFGTYILGEMTLGINTTPSLGAAVLGVAVLNIMHLSSEV